MKFRDVHGANPLRRLTHKRLCNRENCPEPSGLKATLETRRKSTNESPASHCSGRPLTHKKMAALIYSALVTYLMEATLIIIKVRACVPAVVHFNLIGRTKRFWPLIRIQPQTIQVGCYLLPAEQRPISGHSTPLSTSSAWLVDHRPESRRKLKIFKEIDWRPERRICPDLMRIKAEEKMDPRGPVL